MNNNAKLDSHIFYVTECKTLETLSTTSTTMEEHSKEHSEEHTIDILLEPLNDLRIENVVPIRVPIVRVDDQVFVYDQEGLQYFPAVRNYLLFTLFEKVKY